MPNVELNNNTNDKIFDEVAYVNQRVKNARKGILTTYSYFCLTILMIVIGAAFTIFPELIYATAIIGFVFVSVLTILKYIFIERSSFYLDCEMEKLKAETVNRYMEYYKQEIRHGE